MKSSDFLEQKLFALYKKGVLVPRTENNRYLKISYRGSGALISSKWNVKIYTSGAVVCNDEQVIQDILHDLIKPPDASLKTIQIDDAGGGSPICGAMVGVYDGNRILTAEIDVSYFQGDKFKDHAYLDAYATAGIGIVHNGFKAVPDTHRIEICTGYINSTLRDRLRNNKFDVRVVEITGYLQDNLEGLFKDYVKKETGRDLAYDPKGMNKKDLSNSYYKVLEWGKKNTPHLLKTGWKSIQES